MTLVETIIGCHFIGLRLKRYVSPLALGASPSAAVPAASTKASM